MPLPTLDTLARSPATDSIAGTHFDSLSATHLDSLAAHAADSGGFAQAGVWDAAAVYGAASEPVRIHAVETAAAQNVLTGNIWFSALMLIVLGLYCLMLYLYREQIVMCLKGLVNFKPEDKFTAEHGHLYNSFIVYAVVLCTLCIAIELTKFTETAFAPSVSSAMPGWVAPLAGLMFWAVAVLVLTFQNSVLKIIGELTLSAEFTARISEAKNTLLAASAVLITPAVFLWSGLYPMWDSIIIYIIVSGVGIMALALLLRTFLLFVRQKVSLLIWILYLCAVEIFPIALVWALVAKNF